MAATRLSLENLTAIPRVTGMVVSPDGRRVVLSVQSLSPNATRFVTSLWELPGDGSAAPRRLTFSDAGEANPAFLPDGSLAFTSARPDPTSAEGDAGGRLWLLPAGGGEARPLLSLPAPITAAAAAAAADTLVVRAALFPGSAGLGDDAARGRRRHQAGVSGVLHDSLPLRWWDHDIGPRHARLLRLRGVCSAEPPEVDELTPDAVVQLEGGEHVEDEVPFTVSPDGETVVATWLRPQPAGFRKAELVVLRAGERRPLPSGDLHVANPQIAPDGRRVVALAHDEGSPERCRRVVLWLCDLESGEAGPLGDDLPGWPEEPRWAPDGSAVYVLCEERMRRPVYRVDLATRRATRLTEEGAFESICPAPEPGRLYGLRSSPTSPPEAVRLETGGTVSALPTPGIPLDLPGAVTAMQVEDGDGTTLRAWLVMPPRASESSPAPLVLWIHGGPFSSWSSWSWRWCPHLLAERGYAVLMPDPALSTGHGQAFIERAWGTWGDRVMADLFTVLDAALRRPDLDPARTAAMGGSFGGYMAAWIAGHSDRFRAIVDHAGLWSLEQFRGTTDELDSWDHQFGLPEECPERYAAASPDRSAAAIRTPMLVTHGGRDLRVPISEALRLWTDLQRHGVPAQLLHFPDENHWILRPGNSRVWYEAVLAFLDHHVLGREYARPELL
jgi:dipeptidyl aminopeptidase/acylaminoacyl peptidase